MFKKVISQIEIAPDYVTSLSKADFDKNESKIDQEIKKIEQMFPLHKRFAVKVKFNNKEQTVDEFLKLLKQQKADILEKKNIRQVYDTSLFHNIGGKNVDVSTEESRDGLKRDLAALQRQIQALEEDLAQIDNFIVTLYTGETATLNITAHTSAEFVKTADQPTEEEVLEPVREYFNDLYEETPGSPDYGDDVTKKYTSSQPRFKITKK
jgi:hypothetical protein